MRWRAKVKFFWYLVMQHWSDISCSTFSPWILWFPFLRTDAVDILSPPLSEISNEWPTPLCQSDCLLVERGGKRDSFLVYTAFLYSRNLVDVLENASSYQKTYPPNKACTFSFQLLRVPGVELLMSVKVKLNTGILVLFQLIMLLRAHEP